MTWSGRRVCWSQRPQLSGGAEVVEAAGEAWRISLYQPDTTESSAPFISQASVLNTAYSTANIPVTAVDPSSNTITVEASSWAPLIASSPVLFGPTAAQYGLTPGVPYYVRSTPTKQTDPTTGATTYTFQISTLWKQNLSGGNVPIQNTGAPGPVVNLRNPGGAVNLEWGPIQPVSQLGSQQLTSGKLVKNADGSVTIWIAPKLPSGAPRNNWLPSRQRRITRPSIRAQCRPRSGH
jgi:Protein of unknown function (DUF1214)